MKRISKRSTAILAGVTLGAASMIGTGIAVAANVIPGAGGQKVHMCYAEDSAKTPNLFVQFRTQNFGKCGAGYKPFTITQPQDAGINANGPYPGDTNLQGGPRNSDEKWTGDDGAKLHTSWVTCAPGQVATGGGFSTADEGDTGPDAPEKGFQVANSSPAQVDQNGKVTTIAGGYTEIPGDPNGAFKPNGWVVQGWNNNDSGELIVRPFVVCGKG